MAATPPPLPSSSDDSEFDDEDFGCFKSSVPVKAPYSVSKQSEQNCKNSVHDNYNDKINNYESDETSLDANADERSDLTCGDISKEELTVSSVESLPKDVSAHQLEETEHSFTKPPENQLSEEAVEDGISTFSETSRSVLTSPEESKVENKFSDEIVEQEIEEADHAVEDNNGQQSCPISGEQESIHVEQSEEETDSITNVVNDCCDNVSKDTDEGLYENQNIVEQTEISDNDNDSQEPAGLSVNTCHAEHIEEEHTEEEDFGDWGEVTESVDNKDHEETMNRDIVTSNDISEMKDDVSLQTNNLDIPITISEDDDQNSLPCGDDNKDDDDDDDQNSLPCGDDNKDDDDDDFGDFADFSSHEEPRTKSDIFTEENIAPISFRTGSFDATDEGSSDVDIKNFTNESSAVLEKADVDDDDDDWGFKSANADGNAESDDDFGNFGSADDNGGGDDWASFNEPSVPAVDSEEIDDDFSDFSGNDLQSSSFSKSDPSSTKTVDNSNKVEKVVFLCFPSSHQPPVTRQNEESDESTIKSDTDTNEIDGLCAVVEMGINITPQAKEETWTIVKEIRNKDPIVGTWGRLKDVNSSHALDYGWNNSYCCQQVFSTLHIDTKNVLFSQKKQAVPFYTTGLGILEPIRGGPNPGDKNQPSVQPTLLDTGKPEETNKVLDIPPVDFDWGSSGLTNPLKVFKNESFNPGLSSLEPFSDVLQKNTEPTKELSAEAKSILSKIPNLNFMRSKVLMFPIKD